MKRILLVLSFLSFAAYGMIVEHPSTRADVKTFFIPQEQAQMRNELFQNLEHAREKVAVAVYWITDKAIINKLIDIKKRKGIDVQVILDESSGSVHQTMNSFLQNKIVPLIYPSMGVGKSEMGKMHNKFVVIDDKTTFTGSLNFTVTACDPKCTVFNLENVLALNSRDIAQKFLKNFVEMKNYILRLYVDLVASADLPAWFRTLAPYLMKQNDNFKDVAVSVFPEIKDRCSRERVQDFFGLVVKRVRLEAPTLGQRIVLTRLGYCAEDMSKEQAFRSIEDFYRNNARGVLCGPGPGQIPTLNKESIPWEYMSYDEAYDIVGEIWEAQKHRK